MEVSLDALITIIQKLKIPGMNPKKSISVTQILLTKRIAVPGLNLLDSKLDSLDSP
jgi:hypothetical protein